MRIPIHQIHNVLDAYARRLKLRHGAGPETDGRPAGRRIDAGSGVVERRWLIDKISTDVIRRILCSGEPAPDTDAESPPAPSLSHPPDTDTLHYHILTPEGEKIQETIRIEDTDFLIRQIEETARDGRE